MTNEEWLDYMAHNDIPGLSTWFKAERTESPTSATMQHIGQVIEDTVKRCAYGDTAALRADSRERLEADAERYIEHAADYAYEDVLWADETFTLYDAVIELLDRQAAITAEETSNAWEEYRDATQREIAELTAERDNLKANNEQLHMLVGEQAVKIDELQAQVDKLTAERQKPNPDCSAMLYKTFTGNMCSHYEPKDGVVAILREAARNLSDYHDAGEALRRLTDTTNVYHALETLADMVECDYVRRESIEEVMDNDRALVEENSMLARELLKLRAELDAAKQQISQFDAPKSVETSENPASKCEISDFDVWSVAYEIYCAGGYVDNGNEPNPPTDGIRKLLDRQAAITQHEITERWAEHLHPIERECGDLRRKVDELKADNDRLAKLLSKSLEEYSKLEAERDELKGQVFTLKGECEDLENELHELTTERDEAREECIELHNDILRVNSKCDRYRLMCSEMATKIQDALSIADEGLA